MKLNSAYFNLYLYTLTAFATMIGVYALARLVEMPLKAVDNKWIRIIGTALVAAVAALAIIGCLIWVWVNYSQV